MMTQMYYVFGKDIKTTGVLDNIFHNVASDVMTLEVYGNFTGEILIEGRVDKNNENFSQISGILNIGDFSIVNSITSTGIFQYSIDGLRDIRVNVKSINGSANITAKMTSSAE